MKLSRTGWNNVIIFSVMLFILLINLTNKKLFNENESHSSSAQFILPEHSVILSLLIESPDNKVLHFERIGRRWQMTAQGVLVDFNQQQIQQLILSWQQSSGLVQASDMIVKGQRGTRITLFLADLDSEQHYILYPLSDQLLVYNQQNQLWLALPAVLSNQLLPI
jgi:hypothetical protein